LVTLNPNYLGDIENHSNKLQLRWFKQLGFKAGSDMKILANPIQINNPCI